MDLQTTNIKFHKIKGGYSLDGKKISVSINIETDKPIFVAISYISGFDIGSKNNLEEAAQVVVNDLLDWRDHIESILDGSINNKP